MAGGRRSGDYSVKPEVSRVAKWSTSLEGPQGISLSEELERLKIKPSMQQEILEACRVRLN